MVSFVFCLQVSTLTSILLSLIPFVMLILFNILIYRLIKSKSAHFPRSSTREKRDLRIARILILIIMVYVACHGIITYINAVELWAIIEGKRGTYISFSTNSLSRFRPYPAVGPQHEHYGVHLSCIDYSQLLI